MHPKMHGEQLVLDIERAQLPPYDPDVLYITETENQELEDALKDSPDARSAFRNLLHSVLVPTEVVQDDDPRLVEQEKKWEEEKSHDRARASERRRLAMQREARAVPSSMPTRKGPRSWRQRNAAERIRYNPED
jgi:hypothetical protein